MPDFDIEQVAKVMRGTGTPTVPLDRLEERYPAFPGIIAFKSKITRFRGYFETINPLSGAVGKLRGTVWSEEMYFDVGPEKPLALPWWDPIYNLFTPHRDVMEWERKLNLEVLQHNDILHVRQFCSLCPDYEPIVSIKYHFVFLPRCKAFFWYNIRQYGQVDTPPGSPTRVVRVNAAGRVPVGWALPCNKPECFDSYYWDSQYHEICNGGPDLWINRKKKELPWLESKGAPPEKIMLYYDSREIYGGNGAIMLEGWTKSALGLTCSMSRQYPGANRRCVPLSPRPCPL